MHFLLVGHGGSYNRGCEAIVRTTLSMIREEFKGARFTISSFDFENEKLVDFGPDVQIIPGDKPRDTWSLAWMSRQIRKVISPAYKRDYWMVKFAPIIPYLKTADVVLSVGGDNYSMDYAYPFYVLELNRLVKRYNKKLVIWGASIGPFPDDERLKGILNDISIADLITVRETYSLDYLEKLGIQKNVRLVADPAFLLKPEPADFVADKGDILGFNISSIFREYRNQANEINIIDEIVEFLKWVIEEKNLTVYLIPHVVRKGGANNDYHYMKVIADKLNKRDRVRRIAEALNASQLKYVISQCRFFIGARTHATIAALSTGVPTLCLGYSWKAEGINVDIFNSLDYVLGVNEFNVGNLKNKFRLMCERESQIRAILADKIPGVRKMSYKNVEYLKEMIS